MTYFAAIEAGGTKFICAIYDELGNVIERTRIDTTTPEQTLGQVELFFHEQRHIGHNFRAIGIGTFGPVDLDINSDRFGYITKTPKPSWSNTDFLTRLTKRFDVPGAIDTDVNAAALAEQQLGAGKGCDVVIYVTVGTGLGGGVVINGQPLHGLVHPEIGHMLITMPEGVSGCCPFHASCLEGVASGTGMRHLWQVSAETLDPSHEAWDLQAYFMAQMCHNLLLSLSPQKIILGGGVMQQDFLIQKVIEQTKQSLANYLVLPTGKTLQDIIVPPGLGTESGLTGAYILAQKALNTV